MSAILEPEQMKTYLRHREEEEKRNEEMMKSLNIPGFSGKP
ncbi:MAG: hypothetical protein ACKO2G_09785 [Verrucomicrobiales bacterium]